MKIMIILNHTLKKILIILCLQIPTFCVVNGKRNENAKNNIKLNSDYFIEI